MGVIKSGDVAESETTGRLIRLVFVGSKVFPRRSLNKSDVVSAAAVGVSPVEIFTKLRFFGVGKLREESIRFN